MNRRSQWPTGEALSAWGRRGRLWDRFENTTSWSPIASDGSGHKRATGSQGAFTGGAQTDRWRLKAERFLKNEATDLPENKGSRLVKNRNEATAEARGSHQDNPSFAMGTGRRIGEKADR